MKFAKVKKYCIILQTKKPSLNLVWRTANINQNRLQACTPAFKNYSIFTSMWNTEYTYKITHKKRLINLRGKVKYNKLQSIWKFLCSCFIKNCYQSLVKGGFLQSTPAPHQKHSSSQIYLSVEHLNRLVSMHLANTEPCLVREACPCCQSIDKYRLEIQGRRYSRVRVETSHFLNNTYVL